MVDGEMDVVSSLALLDVGDGRHGLKEKLERIDKHGGKGIPVVIRGFVKGPWEGDGGVSQMFEVDVDAVELG